MRVMRFELISLAWKANNLPLIDTRSSLDEIGKHGRLKICSLMKGYRFKSDSEHTFSLLIEKIYASRCYALMYASLHSVLQTIRVVYVSLRFALCNIAIYASYEDMCAFRLQLQFATHMCETHMCAPAHIY